MISGVNAEGETIGCFSRLRTCVTKLGKCDTHPRMGCFSRLGTCDTHPRSHTGSHRFRISCRSSLCADWLLPSSADQSRSSKTLKKSHLYGILDRAKSSSDLKSWESESALLVYYNISNSK